MVTRETVLNAVIGAVLGVLLSFLPFSPLLGGIAAGFLESRDGRDGAVVGALAGALMFVPIAALGFLLLAALGFGFGVGALPGSGALAVLFVLAIAGSTVFLYTVGLAAVGGLLGAALADEYPRRRTSARETIGMSADGRPAPGGRRRSGSIEDRDRPDR